jgi:hypothetical protein
VRAIDLLRQAIDPDFTGGLNSLGNTFVQADWPLPSTSIAVRLVLTA